MRSASATWSISAPAAAELALITGGSGIAMGLPANFRRAGRLDEAGDGGSRCRTVGGHAAVLAGSCSAATLAQIERHRRERRRSLALDPLALAEGGAEVERGARLGASSGSARRRC